MNLFKTLPLMILLLTTTLNVNANDIQIFKGSVYRSSQCPSPWIHLNLANAPTSVCITSEDPKIKKIIESRVDGEEMTFEGVSTSIGIFVVDVLDIK